MFLAGFLLLCLLMPGTASAAREGIVWARMVPDAGGSGTQMLILADTQVNDGMLLLRYDPDRLTYEGLLKKEDAVALYAVNDNTPGYLMISWVCHPYVSEGSGVLLLRLCFAGSAGAESFEVTGQFHDPDGREIPLETVDLSGLEAALAEAGMLRAADYTPESWAVLAEKAEAGRRVLEDPQTSRREADAAAREIRDAMESLTVPEIPETTEPSEPAETTAPTEIPEPTEAPQPTQPAAADTRALERTLEKARKIQSRDYTQESYALLQAAMDQAREVLADAGASQDAVDAVVRELESALAGLKRIPGTNAATADLHRIGLAGLLAGISLLGIAGAGWLLVRKGWGRG